MFVHIKVNVGDIIYIYDPEDNYIREKVVDNILLTGTGKDTEIYLRADNYDDIICTYFELLNLLPDNGGLYYFRTEQDRNNFIKQLNKN